MIRNTDCDIFKDTEGLRIEIDVREDLSSATVSKLKIVKPSGSESLVDCSTSATKLIYTTEEGDLDESGTYILYPYVELGSGWKGYGAPVYLVVKDPT